METLNIDCLSQIFLNLDFVERVRLEQVCPMFYYVLQHRSAFSDNAKLDISKFLINTTAEYYQQESISFAPTALGVVERCGRYVQELTFGQQWLKISQPIIDCIANNCHRLRIVDLGAVILNADISVLLDRIAPQLEDFSLEETSWVEIECGQKVQIFFKSMKNLEKLNLRSAMFTLDRINDLPNTLRYLEIGGAHSFPSEVFLDFLQEQKNLEEFDAAPIPVLDEDIIVALGQLPKLYHLSIGYSYNADLRFDPLSGLTTLKSLKLQTVAGITEMSLRLILSFMHHLESLSISNCGNILDYSSLELCTNIHTLEIKDTMQLANEDIFTLCTYGKLKRLVLSNCFNLSTRGVNTALMRCQLKELTVNKCIRVTDEMMYTLASTQRELEMISIQGCSSITSKGASALAWLRNVNLLREVDVSKNRNVDDSVIINLHNALTMSRRRNSNYEYGSNTKISNGKSDPERLVMYTFDTSVSVHLEYEVNNLILLR